MYLNCQNVLYLNTEVIVKTILYVLYSSIRHDGVKRPDTLAAVLLWKVVAGRPASVHP